MKRTCMGAALLWAACGVILGGGAQAWAEGSAQIGTNQGLRAETPISMDIVNPDTERIAWLGLGTLTVLGPQGQAVGQLSSGQSVNALGGVSGVYTATVSQKQESGTDWDIRVEERGTGAEITGRVFSTQWGFDAGLFTEDRATNASFFVKVPAGDGVNTTVVELRYEGLAGFIFTLLVNQLGIVDSPGRSVPQANISIWTPLYPIYFSPPQTATYTILDPEVTGFRFVGGELGLDQNGEPVCSQLVPGTRGGTFQFTSNVQGSYQLVCDLNRDGVFDPTSSEDHLIAGRAFARVNAVTWDGLTRSGDEVDPGMYDCRVTVLVGETHYIGLDMETAYEGLRMFRLDEDRNRLPLRMYWDDSLIQANAVVMRNGQFGLETSGAQGIDSGDPEASAVPNVNARSWGNFDPMGNSKGNEAALDTYTYAASTFSTTITLEAADVLADSDMDGLQDYTEACLLGTDPDDPDSDGDGLGDFEETDGGSRINTDGRDEIDALDTDSDNDGVSDGLDSSPRDPNLCEDSDNDSCDDCAMGRDNLGPLADNRPDNDGLDTDSDGLCDAGDLDDDNDGVGDSQDQDRINRFICQDSDNDSCDDCASGTFNPSSDGLDLDGDGLCDNGDPDDDGDGVNDSQDLAPRDPLHCGDRDGDSCDDCSSGSLDPNNDGQDTDGDGLCDNGDPDDDNDGVGDTMDDAPRDPRVCQDADSDGCDDCAVGRDGLGPLADNQPGNDGPDNDGDGLCDMGDPDDDNDGVGDSQDQAPRDRFACRDSDGDGCDDCSSGSANPANDGADLDSDGLCDSGDPDDDNDGVSDGQDEAPRDRFVCRDSDNDGCDDCTSGSANPTGDGVDLDSDGLCDNGDPDDDNDGVEDSADDAPRDRFACRDSDQDSCDDCSSGTFAPGSDGADLDGDGLCDNGDPDDDNDGVSDGQDEAPRDRFVCRDSDNDGCDDCSSGTFAPGSDGEDFDGDGLCDGGDPDDDNDGAMDEGDEQPNNRFVCSDQDNDGCDDCSSGQQNPAQDGPDNDSDGLCDEGDPDDDNDGVEDGQDLAPGDATRCGDSDSDGCDDCSSGRFAPGNDGADLDGDGLCDEGDPDDDNDGVGDGQDEAPRDRFACRDSDQDTCDDCSSGAFDPSRDGLDTDGDGFCDVGDEDTDNDGVRDDEDEAPQDRFRCGDSDEDGCEDCSSGRFNPGADGADLDEDGLCNNGDPDDDNDGVNDDQDEAPLDHFVCGDSDNDSCDDCDGGSFNPSNDGADTDGDGLCDAGDPDDDNDGVGDGDDLSPLDASLCGDSDGDRCDDCAIGVDGLGPQADHTPENDGTDTDGDGLCDMGDPDDDNDGVEDEDDLNALIPTVCGDQDNDGCDDCSSGRQDPTLDGPDNDGDGLCDSGDPDDDNDGVEDGQDEAPMDRFVCRDVDQDTCDDCSSGVDDVGNDGQDTDGDGFCDVGDEDTDNDGVRDDEDEAPADPSRCRDADNDGCDDCARGRANPLDDGEDFDSDGLCDGGDPDDDNDGVEDEADGAPRDPSLCRDSDNDSCDDCAVGTDGTGPEVDADPTQDGTDTDNDGLCDNGDPDDDNDGVEDEDDLNALIPTICGDSDQDGCDDCSSGRQDPTRDGDDFDGDGLCDSGDPDDDNDGVEDEADDAPLDPSLCRDSDNDSCDDCAVGTDGAGPEVDADPGNDGPDRDGDGACDAGDEDTDNDGVPDGDDLDPNDPSICGDSDSDGCDDCARGRVNPSDDGDDFDGDGLCDAGDSDDDNDGVNDSDDLAPNDPSRCGDSDSDSCDDCARGAVDVNDDGDDFDGDGLCDLGDGDDDNDGLSDEEEEELGTNPQDDDSDDDGVPDGQEGGDNAGPGDDSDNDGDINALDADSDNDGLLDGTELGLTEPAAGTDEEAGNFVPDADPTTTTDPVDADTDDGGVPDGEEDRDQDGAVDEGERDPNEGEDDLSLDEDMDGLTDGEEEVQGTDPTDPDSDGDGLLDGQEVELGTDPTDGDSDEDGVPDGQEGGDSAGPGDDSDEDGLINALDPDSDNDGLLDGTEQGLTEPAEDTDLTVGNFVPDADPASTTAPVDADSDDGGVPDGEEDEDHNGRVDGGERDPNDGGDDIPVVDTDVDGIEDAQDNCPMDANQEQLDLDGDGLGDACDEIDDRPPVQAGIRGSAVYTCAAAPGRPSPGGALPWWALALGATWAWRRRSGRGRRQG